MDFTEEAKFARRLTEVLTVLFQTGFETAIYELELHSKITFFNKLKTKLKKRRNLETDLTNAVIRLGGVFVKGGQILSTKPELVGKEFAERLTSLQDQVPAESFEKIRDTIEKELGSSIQTYFATFDEKAVSGASLGQVHKATLIDGTEVAVKVQRKDIDKTVELDLRIIEWLIEHIEKKQHPLSKYHLHEALEEVRRYTYRELDYRLEAENLRKLRNFFKQDNTVVIPKPYEKLTTKRILVMQWIEGQKISEFYKTSEGKSMQEYGTKSMIQQYFDYGLFQGDPHPGNFLVTKNKQLVYLDLGMMGEFDSKTKKQALELFIDVLNLDPEAVTNDLLDMHRGKKEVDRKKLFRSIRELIEDWNGKEIKEYPISKLLYNLLLCGVEQGITLPTNLILFGKSIVTVENLAVSLNPQFNLIKHVKPDLINILKQKHRKQYLAFQVKNTEKLIENEVIKGMRKTSRALQKAIR